MIRAKLNHTTDGKTTIIVGLSAPDMDMLMVEEKPVAMSLEDLGIEVNLIIIARPNDSQLVEAVGQASGDEEMLVVDKRNEAGFARRVLDRPGFLNREDRRQFERIARRRKRR